MTNIILIEIINFYEQIIEKYKYACIYVCVCVCV